MTINIPADTIETLETMLVWKLHASYTSCTGCNPVHLDRVCLKIVESLRRKMFDLMLNELRDVSSLQLYNTSVVADTTSRWR